jgi:SAM-dependent methyltransferase
MFRKVIPGTTSRLRLVDHNETYGRHLLDQIVQTMEMSLCVDLGYGNGEDLTIIKSHHPTSRYIGIDASPHQPAHLQHSGIKHVALDLETQPLPLESDTVDLVIANQILEHTKEIFWINHEIFRVLKTGGYLYLGVPNVLSLHNRLLGLFGVHPTCAKLLSAHVRVFSKSDTLSFYRELASDSVTVEGFYGAQFYPFPKVLARPLATLFPSLAVSIFFLIRKSGSYNNQFLDWLSAVPLQSNFHGVSDT